MNYIARDKDVIYGKSDLEDLYTFDKFPVFMGCCETPAEEDLFSDMAWKISKSSGIIQLNPLLPLDVVYKEAHGSGTTGNLWDTHHSSFSQFILRHGSKNVLEIGGSHGILASKIKKDVEDFNWTIIDPNPCVDDVDIKVIRGFFDENFKSDGKYETVVHSHLLEHIYDPQSFCRNISNFLEVGNKLIFSVPNMEEMFHRKYTNFLNFEHTIYLSDVYIREIMEMNGFSFVESEYFREDHSIFYCFEKSKIYKTDSYKSLDFMYFQNKMLYHSYINHHKTDVDLINNSTKNSNGPVFLFGAHIFSQYLISFGLDVSKIHGLIDNDSKKHGKRLYGTNFICENPKVLKDFENPIVILRAGIYNEEIKHQILFNINSKTIFI